jgi:hypothetical protein
MPINDVEAVLARLMPPAISQASQTGIEAMLDELAAARPELAAVKAEISRTRWYLLSGIAATIIAATTALVLLQPAQRQQSSASKIAAPAWVLVSESNRFQAMTDEGWRDQTNGSAMRAVRLQMVGENLLKDVETGMIVKVSEPREEIVFMPISAF